ncbi:hypothetical protein GLR44_00485 [Escherichia coli]|nr:hypothetical protein [Escherichia coli]EFH4292567.1 hypothetical protein [Escherichia coli]EFH7176463.1 hypothetical protein [Escherichia coli]EFI5337873.1 hypothetical protein [Escherichia coli]
MSLLFAERPLVINTQLAMKIGLNEAIAGTATTNCVTRHRNHWSCLLNKI